MRYVCRQHVRKQRRKVHSRETAVVYSELISRHFIVKECIERIEANTIQVYRIRPAIMSQHGVRPFIRFSDNVLEALQLVEWLYIFAVATRLIIKTGSPFICVHRRFSHVSFSYFMSLSNSIIFAGLHGLFGIVDISSCQLHSIRTMSELVLQSAQSPRQLEMQSCRLSGQIHPLFDSCPPNRTLHLLLPDCLRIERFLDGGSRPSVWRLILFSTRLLTRGQD